MMNATSRFEGKHAIITGAGSGIGRAIALRFSNEGAVVYILELNESDAKETAELIREAGGKCQTLACDVSQLESVQSAFSKIKCVDILINNAGIASIGNVEATTPEEMDRIYAVNVKGVYHCLKAVVPKMKKKGNGVILNLASIASKVGIQDRFAYSMSKGAVLTMTLSVARDYVDAGIRCNCVCPARVHTPLVDAFLEKHYADQKEEMMEKLSRYQPIGRMGQPQDIAALAAFLCSDEAAYITGSAYDIDGGVTLLR